MTKLRALLAWAALSALAFTAGAVAQVAVTSQLLTGNEAWQVGQGIGGSSFFTTTAQMRNATGMHTFSGSGAQTYQMLNTDSTLFWIGTAPTTWAVTTPVAPFDGQVLQFGTDTTLTTLVTLTPSTGQTLQAAFSAQTLTAGTPLKWIYVLATTKWQRIQ